MSHISNIAAAADQLNITDGDARASIPALLQAWKDACDAHCVAGIAAHKSGDYSACKITAEARSAAQRALNAAQWAAGQRWSLRVS